MTRYQSCCRWLAQRLFDLARWVNRQSHSKWTLHATLGLVYRGIPIGGREDEYAWRPVLLKDPCVYCGGRSTTIDHIRALAHGGRNGWRNEAGACLDCNGQKQDAPLLHFMLHRRRGVTERLHRPMSAPARVWGVGGDKPKLTKRQREEAAMRFRMAQPVVISKQAGSGRR